MSWSLVARKDFEDAFRSRLLWAILGVSLGLILVIIFAFGISSAASSALDVMELFSALGGQLVVPIIALIAGYMAVVGERQSGSLLILHGLPHSRRDIVIGKVVGRTGVVALATLGAFVVGGGLLVFTTDTFSFLRYIKFTFLTILLAAAFTAIAVGLSAATATRGRAMAGAIGSYMGFLLLWEPVIAGVFYLVEGHLPGYKVPAWYFLLERLSPGFAYIHGISSLLDRPGRALIGFSNVVENIPADVRAEEGAMMLTRRVAGDVPFYLDDWFVVVVLLGWILFAAGVGYLRFRSADLN